MKKWLIIVLFAFLIVILSIYSFVVDIDKDELGIARYIYNDMSIETEISSEDMIVIAEILDGKYIDVFVLPACGFDENIAIVVGNKTFCIACDECGTIYFKESNGYIDLDCDENDKLRSILAGYGFEWPCY